MTMQRRTFLKTATASVLGSGAVPALGGTKQLAADFGPLHSAWTTANDESVARSLRQQQRTAGGRHEGGYANEFGIFHAGTAAHRCGLMVTAYVNPDSKYFRSEEVADSLQLAIGFLRRLQHQDGTIDLVTTNFHSPPDTAFVVEPLARAQAILRQHAPNRLPGYRESAAEFLKLAGMALVRGGVHTPNHRWVVSMALAQLNALFPSPAYVDRIDQWLAEGIDIDPDGQYSERSVAVYSPLVDRCLITIARLLNRPTLLDPVRRNLDMTRYFVRANGELVTESSRRQDKYQIALAGRYYYPYRYLAVHEQNADYSAMVHFIEETVGLGSLAGTQPLYYEDQSIGQRLPDAGNLPTEFVKPFPYSDVVRIRRGRVDATIVSHNTTWFTFSHGQAVLQAIRLASAFFGRGQFAAESIEAQDSGEFILRQSLTAPYYQPATDAQIAAATSWRAFRDLTREQSEIQTLDTVVTIRERDGCCEIVLQVGGTDHVPVAVELAFRHGGQLHGAKELPGQQNAYLLGEGQFGTFDVQGDQIRFGPGLAEHQWIQLRGAEPKLDAQCVYLTGSTPFETTLTIEAPNRSLR